MKPNTSKPSDSTNSQTGTPNGIRAIITIGEVKGMIDVQKASGPSGDFKTVATTKIPRINGIVTGHMNWLVSSWSSTAAPIAANKEAYNR